MSTYLGKITSQIGLSHDSLSPHSLSIQDKTVIFCCSAILILYQIEVENGLVCYRYSSLFIDITVAVAVNPYNEILFMLKLAIIFVKRECLSISRSSIL